MKHRIVGLVVAVLGGAALGSALASEYWGGLVPCALCLLERWPYRVMIGLGVLAALLPPRFGRMVLWLLVLVLLWGLVLGVVHVGVEWKFWPSPLPECAGPDLSGLSIAERLARMPARPGKPCDDATYLIPFLPVSMAMMNLLFCAVLGGGVVTVLRRRGGGAA